MFFLNKNFRLTKVDFDFQQNYFLSLVFFKKIYYSEKHFSFAALSTRKFEIRSLLILKAFQTSCYKQKNIPIYFLKSRVDFMFCGLPTELYYKDDEFRKRFFKTIVKLSRRCCHRLFLEYSHGYILFVVIFQ